MQNLAPIITVPRRFWDEEFGDAALPKEVTVTFEVVGQARLDVSTQGFVSVASEDAEIRLSGLWAVSHDHFPGYRVIGWYKEDEQTVKLQLQPPDAGNDDEPASLDQGKRRAPADLPEPQAKVQALGHPTAAEPSMEQAASGLPAELRQEVRDGAKPLQADTPQRLVAPAAVPAGRGGGRRGGGGRTRGGSRGNATGRGCAKLVRTTTRLYIGVGQVREWLGEVGARTELQVKVMLDNRMLYGVHQADLLYNKGAHYYWITSRTLKRTAMGKWFLGWNHTPSDGLVLLLRSPSKEEIAAAIAEGFQAKEEEEETELSEQLQQQQQQQQQQSQQQRQLQQQAFQKQLSMAQAVSPLSPPSPRQGRLQQQQSLAALASMQYMEEELPPQPLQHQQLGAPEIDDMGNGGQYQRLTPLGAAVRLGGPIDDEDAISGLSGDSGLRRALGPSDPRLMAALAVELQRGRYGVGASEAQGAGRRAAQAPSGGHGSRLVYSGGPDSLDFQQQSGLQQLSGGSRQRSGSALGISSVQAQYRSASGRTASEGLNAQAAAEAAAGAAMPRLSGGHSARLTNFSEVPGGSAFGNVLLPGELLPLEQLPLASQQQPQQQQQQQRSAIGAVASQLNTTTSIASNLSLAGVTQLTGAPSILQTSGVAGPIVAPLRLPGNVSELLPPELLPAAVSVRCHLDGALLPDLLFSCEIHRSRQGHCYLYHLPPSVLKGRSQQDWMISDDGCLVLCMTSLPSAATLAENISVRSNPSNSRANLLSAGAELGARPTRVQTSTEEPSLGRAQRTAELAAAPSQPQARAGRAAVPSAAAMSEHYQQTGGQEAMDVDLAAPGGAGPPCMEAELPLADAKPEQARGRPNRISVPRQAIESLYGSVDMPLPVIVRYEVDGELQPKTYLAEVAEAYGELVLRGTPDDVLLGRTLVGWRRMNVLSHQLLVVCLETRSEAAGPQAKAAAQAPARADTAYRGEQAPLERGPALSAQQPQPSLPWATSSELHQATRRVNASSLANPFGPQVSLSGAPAPSSTLPTPRPSLQLQLTTTGPLSGPPLRQQLQSGDSVPLDGLPPLLQSIPSGLLPGVGSSKLPSSTSLLNTGSALPPDVSNDGGAPAGARWRATAPAGGVRAAGATAGQRVQPSPSTDGMEASVQRSVFALGLEPAASTELGMPGRRQGGAAPSQHGSAARSSLGLDYVPASALGELHGGQQVVQHAARREGGSQEARKSSGSWVPGHAAGGDLDASAPDRGRRPPGAATGGLDGAAGMTAPLPGAAFTLRFAPHPSGGAKAAQPGPDGRTPELAEPNIREAQLHRSRAEAEVGHFAYERVQVAPGEWRVVKVEQQEQQYEEHSGQSVEPSLRAHLAQGPGRASVSSVSASLAAPGPGRHAQWGAAYAAAADALPSGQGGGQGHAPDSDATFLQQPSRQRGSPLSPSRHPSASPAVERMEAETGGLAADVQRQLRAPANDASGGSGGVARLQGYAAYGLLPETHAAMATEDVPALRLLPMLPPPARTELRARAYGPIAADVDVSAREHADGADLPGGDRQTAEQASRHAHSLQWRHHDAATADGVRHDGAWLYSDADALDAPEQRLELFRSGPLGVRSAASLAASAPAGQQRYPRLDLAGATAPERSGVVKRGLETAAAAGAGPQNPCLPGGDAHEPGGELPPRRPTGVLRMLSAVQREPEEPQS